MRYSRYRRWRMRQRAYWSNWWMEHICSDLTGWWVRWPIHPKATSLIPETDNDGKHQA